MACNKFIDLEKQAKYIKFYLDIKLGKYWQVFVIKCQYGKNLSSTN